MRKMIEGWWDPDCPLWLRLLYRLDYQVLECRWQWFCDWCHDLQHRKREVRR